MAKTLPDEILFTIFKDLSFNDLRNCQYVCRSWYSPAHIILIKEVNLKDDLAIEQFVASFDHNPNQSYMNAVKSVAIWNAASGTLRKETIEKLFFRFSNLQRVEFYHLNQIANFDEELCKAILVSCPLLDTFDVAADDENPEFRNVLVNVRLLLTNIQLSWLKHQSQMGDPVQFVTQFPRLHTLFSEDEVISSLALFLPIFEQLSNVKKLQLLLDTDIDDQYLSAKPKDPVITSLSKITDFSLDSMCNISNTLKFVFKYFTGLKYFKFKCDLPTWSNTEDASYWRDIVDRFKPVKFDYRVEFVSIHFTTLNSFFSSLVQNMFQDIPAIYKQSNSRVLELNVSHQHFGQFESADVSFDSVQLPFSRKVRISIDKSFDLVTVLSQLFKSGARMDEIDVFKFSFHQEIHIDTGMYLSLLETMPSLKQVNLGVPSTFADVEYQDNQPYTGPVLPYVKEATFTVFTVGTIQPLLDNCYHAFPNIESLNIYRYSGVWKFHIGEFQLDLQEYSLRKLTLDVDPVLLMLDKLLVKEDGFFVLEMKILESGIRHLYKVARDLSSITIIGDTDLKDFKCRRDYICVRIIVDFVDQLKFCALKSLKTSRSLTITLNDSK